MFENIQDYIKLKKKIKSGTLSDEEKESFKKLQSKIDSGETLTSEEKKSYDLMKSKIDSITDEDITNFENSRKNLFNSTMEFAGSTIQNLDNILMSDKNFGQQSEAIDNAVHGVSSALFKSKNPYAMLAGAGIEGANFLTKIGGNTVQGFNTNINSSGYGNLGNYSSKSFRDFGTFVTLGGLNMNRMNQIMADRNQRAQMALNAANIANDIKFEQEARMNSTQDIMYQNQIALNGGIDTSLLSAKEGGKLNQIKYKKLGTSKSNIDIIENLDQNDDNENVIGYGKSGIKIVCYDLEKDSKVLKAQNGAKLEQIEVSDDPNVIPEGSLHKNKHADFDLDVTKKGIPVITVKDDNVETLEEIQNQSDSVIQHAEIEESEIIFSKELTDFLEENKNKWNETKDDSILLEVGKRLTKEIIENTDDNTNLIDKLNE